MKIKISTKFRASRRLGFESTKKTMSPEMRPKSVGTFEKTGVRPELLEAWLGQTSVNYRKV